MPPDPLAQPGENTVVRDANGNIISIGQGAQTGQTAAGSNIYQVGQGTINVFGGGHPEQPHRWRVALVHFAEEKETAEVRTVLQKALTQEELKKDFILLPDGEPVENKDKWQDLMFLWTGLAHIVVLLVSPSALESKWFQQTVEFLSGRALVRDQLTVIPVLIGVLPTTFRETLAAKLAPEENWIVAIGTVEEITGGIVERIKDLNTGEPFETVMETLARTISGQLKQVERPALRNAAKSVGLKMAEGIHTDELRIQVAGALWFATVPQWGEALKALATDPSVKPLALLELIKPSWVNLLAALELIPLFQIESPTRAIAVQGSDPQFVGESFLRRARYDGTGSISFVRLNPLDSATPPLIRKQEIKEALKRFFGNAQLSDEELELTLQAYLVDKPLFLIVTPPETEADVLVELLQTFVPPPPPTELGVEKLYSICFIVLCKNAQESGLKAYLAKRQNPPGLEGFAQKKYGELLKQWSKA